MLVDVRLLAAGSILEGPDPNVLLQHVVDVSGTVLCLCCLPAVLQELLSSSSSSFSSFSSQIPELLINLMNDPSVQVRDSVAWTIGRVCEHIPSAVLNDQYLLKLLEGLCTGLLGEPRVATNVCWVRRHIELSHP